MGLQQNEICTLCMLLYVPTKDEDDDSTYIIPTILMCSDCDSDVRSFINSHC